MHAYKLADHMDRDGLRYQRYVASSGTGNVHGIIVGDYRGCHFIGFNIKINIVH